MFRRYLLIADHSGAVAHWLASWVGSTARCSPRRNIFLEAAHFTALNLAGKARKFGMHTDASHRFERGVDAQLPPIAMQRATQLLIEIAGGEAGPMVDAVVADAMPTSPQVKPALCPG